MESETGKLGLLERVDKGKTIDHLKKENIFLLDSFSKMAATDLNELN